MNSGFSDFQDLINTTTSGQAIDDVRADLVALEETVDGNTADIASNLVTIQQNSQYGLTNRMMIEYNGENIAGNSQGIAAQAGFIATNTNNITSNLGLINNNASNISQNAGVISSNSILISDLETDIAANETKISQNEQKIVSNDVDIAALQIDRLKSDGSIQLDFGYVPYNNQDIATKYYVDNSVVSDPTKLNKSNGVVDDNLFINNTSHSLTVIGSNLTYATPAEHHFKVGSTDVAQFTANYIYLLRNVGILGTLNGIYPSELDNISGSTSNVQNQIDTEIARATAAESGNATAIGNNATAIALKLSKSGDTMAGNLTMDGGSLLLENYTDTLRFRNAGFDVGIIGVRAVQPSQALDIVGAPILGINTVKIWNNLDVESNIEFGGSINGISDATLQRISGLTSDAQTQITSNSNDITTNTTNIATNAGNITTNSALANSKVSKSGDTMSGDLNMASRKILFSDGSKLYSNGNYLKLLIPPGKALYFGSSELSIDYHFPITVDVNVPCYLNNHVAISDTLDVYGTQARIRGGLRVDGSYGDMNRGSSHGGVRQIRLYNTFDARASWAMGNQYDEPDSGDNDFYFEVTYTNGVAHQAGYIQDSATNVRMNFTGQHRCQPMFEFKDDMVGLIVESTGSYMNLIKEGEECSQISCITINDSIPVVRLCNEEQSRKVFGVISAREDTDRRTFGGNFVSNYTKALGDERVFINSIGEGGMWVCDTGGNLTNGDYICAAGINGYGMRQASEFLANYTVAKITMDCDFNPELEETKKWVNGAWVMTGEFKAQYQMFELDDGMRIAMIGCTYHCG